MKLPVYSITKVKLRDVELPQQFADPVNADLIKRAVITIQANRRQQYGANPRAGMRHSAKLSRRRRNYKGSYGMGISRVPRKIMSRRGRRFNWVGAEAPGTVGGRQAHPPKPTKDWSQKINRRENRKAIRSALAATLAKELVSLRGHIIPDTYPFIVEDKIESLAKTKEVSKALSDLGFGKELSRTKSKNIRAGKAKSRNRRYQRPVGPLLVVSKECRLSKTGRNIPGVQVVTADSLNAELLAPGAVPGRLTIFTEAGLVKLQKENLFYDRPKKPSAAIKALKKTAKATRKAIIDTAVHVAGARKKVEK